jgi:hypothetical protein
MTFGLGKGQGKEQLLSNTNWHGKCIHVDVGMMWKVFTVQREVVTITKKTIAEWYR